MKKLIIIGNGFDLGHGLKTKFENFIESNIEYPEKYVLFKGEDWNSVEDNYKANLLFEIEERDSINVSEKLEEIITAYGFNEYGEINYYNYNSTEFTEEIDCLNRNVKLVSELEKDFKEYLAQNYNDNQLVQVKPREKVAKILKKASIIISFNYTNTVETVYKEENVIHIHGSITDGNIAIGTEALDSAKESIIDNIYPTEIPCKNKYDFQDRMMYYEEDMDGNLVIDERIQGLFNQIKCSIEEKEEELFKLLDAKSKDSLSSRQLVKLKLMDEKFDEVYIIGHSLGEADISVFEKINKDAKVICYYFSQDEYEKMDRILTDLGVDFDLKSSICLYN